MELQNISRPLFRSFEFTYITAVTLVAHAVLSGVGYLILGQSPYINATSLLLILLLDFVLYWALKKSAPGNTAHILLLSWFVIVFFCVRLSALLLVPPAMLDFLISEEFTAEEISHGLLFIVAGTIALLLGIFSSDALFSKVVKKSSNETIIYRQFSLWGLTAYWLVAYMAAYFVHGYLGVTIFGPPENWGHRMGWIGVIFDADVALLLTILWGFMQWQKNRSLTKYEISYVAVALLVWLIFSVLVGSRGGPLRILNCCFLVALSLNPRFKLGFIKFIVIVVAFYLLSTYVFALGTIFRHYQLGTIPISQVAEDYRAGVSGRQNANKTDLAGVSKLRNKYFQTEEVKVVSQMLRPFVTRLALIDYPLIIVSRVPNMEVINHYIKSLYPLKNFANNLVPGEIFDDALVNSSRVFTMAYRGASLKAISEGYMSEPWTIWGMAWIWSKYFGIILLFAATFTSQMILCVANRLTGGYSPYIRCIYYIVVINLGYMMFGIDHWLNTIAQFSAACFVAFVTLCAIEWMKRKLTMGRK